VRAGVILEGIVTTHNADGSVNISPMGPIVDDAMRRITLRPFRTSTTYANLRRTGVGVLHVTDDVLLFAQAAVGMPEPLPELRSVGEMLGGRSGDLAAELQSTAVIANTCRWYAFQVCELDDAAERTTIVADVAASGVIREFFGFNRAKHAVIEAAILATRVHLLDRGEIESQMLWYSSWVEKTGGPRELEAFAFLKAWIAERGSQSSM
jgi:hypothetical protein